MPARRSHGQLLTITGKAVLIAVKWQMAAYRRWGRGGQRTAKAVIGMVGQGGQGMPDQHPSGSLLVR